MFSADTFSGSPGGADMHYILKKKFLEDKLWYGSIMRNLLLAENAAAV